MSANLAVSTSHNILSYPEVITSWAIGNQFDEGFTTSGSSITSAIDEGNVGQPIANCWTNYPLFSPFPIGQIYKIVIDFTNNVADFPILSFIFHYGGMDNAVPLTISSGINTYYVSNSGTLTREGNNIELGEIDPVTACYLIIGGPNPIKPLNFSLTSSMKRTQ
jgi:hypothetical protein